MSTQPEATVTELHVGYRADETIRRSVKALIRVNGLNDKKLAEKVGMTAATMSRRLNGHGAEQSFKAGEVAAIAEALHVNVQALYDGRIDLSNPPSQPTGPKVTLAYLSSYLPRLRLIRGDADGSPSPVRRAPLRVVPEMSQVDDDQAKSACA